jgi:Uncharacterised nucleotidyltransferase
VSDLWTCVSLLGNLDATDASLARAAELLERLDPAATYDAVLASRVYTVARRGLERLPEAGNGKVVLARLCELEAGEEIRRGAAAAETRAVLEQLRTSRARLIKGLPLRERYTDRSLRHEGDIDVQVPDWSAGRALAGWLRARGWLWDTQEYPWLKWTDGGDLYGQLTLVLPDNADPVARVDLHIGPFSVGHAGLLPLVGWTDATVLGLPARVPDDETALAIIAAHSLNDGYLSMKDINDIHTLLSTGIGPDWASTVELCRCAGATEALWQLRAETARCYPQHPAPAGPIRAVLSGTRELPHQRARRVARLALRDERARRRRPTTAAAVAWDAYRYFSADLTPRLSPTRPAVPAPTSGLRRRDLCWRLLPAETWRRLRAGPTVPVGRVIEDSIADGLLLSRSRQGVAVSVGGDVFVPTVWGDLHPESVALATKLAGE